jgi:hypothetical protein
MQLAFKKNKGFKLKKEVEGGLVPLQKKLKAFYQ